jgi:hypothetical protein
LGTIARETLVASLKAKGFVPSESHHTYLFLHVDGRKTSVFTKVSHGTGHKELGEDLIHAIKRQLKFDKKQQLLDLVNCPMDSAAYIEHLEKSGHQVRHAEPPAPPAQAKKRNK